MQEKKASVKLRPQPLIIGWREWISLPELGIANIKAKVDSGARTSALHAFSIKSYNKGKNKHRIQFNIHPLQYRTDVTLQCEADVVDIRWVTDSGGHRERRYVIKTLAVLGTLAWPIELTLTNRDTMNFRMLLGRTAMANRIVVNPGASYLVKNTMDF